MKYIKILSGEYLKDLLKDLLFSSVDFITGNFVYLFLFIYSFNFVLIRFIILFDIFRELFLLLVVVTN